MLVSDYNYNLPDERIAKFPPEKRGSTRLLVLDRQTGDIQDSYYRELDEFLNPGDVLILNDTRVMQSRLFCTLPDGRKRELVVLEKHGNEPQRVMYRGKLHDGDILTITSNDTNNTQLTPTDTSADSQVSPSAKNQDTNPSSIDTPENSSSNGNTPEHSSLNGDAPKHITNNDRSGQIQAQPQSPAAPTIVVTKILGNGIAEVDSDAALADLAEQFGTVPLPPYLHRDATTDDKKRYQTIWAKHMGSAAAPTASLNMTDELLDRLRQKGVVIKYLTLHVGLGTFLPIRSDEVENHQMHSEWFHIPADTIQEIKRVQSARTASPTPRIIALGTTVARTLEYYAKTGQTEGEDDIFIYPGFEFQIVDALLTNFHAPRSTVLMLASAFAGWEHLKFAYDHAIDAKYNFLSYGDSMLIC